MIDRKHLAGKHELVALESLVTDGRFNRPISNSWVNHIISNFKGEAFGSIVVSVRSDGTMVILDGQHRVEALRELGLATERKCIPARVLTGLTTQDESYLVKTLNDDKNFGPYDKFKALLYAGDPETCHINNIVEKIGLRIGSGSRDGVIVSVTTLQRVYRMSEPKGHLLRQTLRVIIRSWGDATDPLRHEIIEGVARFIHEHPEVDEADLTKKLADMPGGCMGLKGRAKVKRGPSPSLSVPAAIALVIEETLRRRPRNLKAASS